MSIFESAEVLARISRESTSPLVLREGGGTFGNDALLSAVLDHSPIILWAIDSTGKFILSRGAGLQELGLVDNQMLGQNAFELYNEFPDIQKSLRDGLAGQEHHDIVEVNGAIFESWYSPLRTASGAIEGVVGISTVITELTSARRALQESTHQFHQAFQGSPVLMAILKIPQAEFVEVNSAFERRTGYLRAEVRGKSPMDLNLWRCPFLQRNPNYDFSNLISFHDEQIHAVSRSGEAIELMASGARIRFQGEQCILLFARDATEEVRTKRDLMKSERRFATLIRQAPVGIFHCSATGEILSANPHFWSFFQPGAGLNNSQASLQGDGLSATERTRRRWQELFTTEADAPVDSVLQAHDFSTEGFRQELQFAAGLALEGMEWAQVQLEPLPDEEGFLGSVANITAIKRSESASVLQSRELEKAVRTRTLELEKMNQRLIAEIEKHKQTAYELQISKEQMQSVVKNAVDYIIHVTPAGIIEYINRVAPGLTREQVIGSHISLWTDGEHREKSAQALKDMLAGVDEVSVELPVVYPNGERQLLSVRGAANIVEGVIVGASIVARDITRERELEEEERQRTEAMTHLSRLCLAGEMSASMSHELKQPLLAIGNYAEGCLKRIQDRSITREQMVESLELIARLSQKSRDILHRTREFVANRPFSPQCTRLHQLVEESLMLVQSDLKNQTISLEIDCPAELPEVYVDAVQIQQVIINILVNGIEAISSKTSLDPGRIHICGRDFHQERVTLSISDNGPGIPEQMMASLFDAFRTGKKKGLGMGLAISRSIMENHGGTLKVAETTTAGTTFEIQLPVCKEPVC